MCTLMSYTWLKKALESNPRLIGYADWIGMASKIDFSPKAPLLIGGNRGTMVDSDHGG